MFLIKKASQLYVKASHDTEEYPPYIGENSMFIQDFNPQDKVFYFNFPGDTCYKNKNGICALDRYSKELKETCNFNYNRDRSKYPKCVNIYFGLRDKAIKRSIPLIYQFECGHYMCNDGQHRICVAQRMGLTLDVEYYKDILEGSCDRCNSRFD